MTGVLKWFSVSEVRHACLYDLAENGLVFNVRIQIKVVAADKEGQLAFIGLGVGTVDPDKIELRIKIRYQHVSMLEDRLKQVSSFTQSLLGLLSLGNILRNLYRPDYLARIIEDRIHGYMPESLVRELFLQFLALPRFHSLDYMTLLARLVPPITRFIADTPDNLVLRHTMPVCHRFTRPARHHVPVSEYHQVGQVFKDGRFFFFYLAQRLFGSFTLIVFHLESFIGTCQFGRTFLNQILKTIPVFI